VFKSINARFKHRDGRGLFDRMCRHYQFVTMGFVDDRRP
jgi:hypothetical protein